MWSVALRISPKVEKSSDFHLSGYSDIFKFDSSYSLGSPVCLLEGQRAEGSTLQG